MPVVRILLHIFHGGSDNVLKNCSSSTEIVQQMQDSEKLLFGPCLDLHLKSDKLLTKN